MGKAKKIEYNTMIFETVKTISVRSKPVTRQAISNSLVQNYKENVIDLYGNRRQQYNKLVANGIQKLLAEGLFESDSSKGQIRFKLSAKGKNLEKDKLRELKRKQKEKDQAKKNKEVAKADKAKEKKKTKKDSAAAKKRAAVKKTKNPQNK